MDFKLFDIVIEYICICVFNVEWVSIYKRWRVLRVTLVICFIEKDVGVVIVGKREEKNFFLM